MQHKKTISRDLIWLLLAIFFSSIAVFSFAQNKEKEPVIVKIVKIVDGDTVTIEKSMDESNVQDLTKQFQNIKGKNVQVMVSVEDKDHAAKKGKQPSSMHFNINMDSAMANAFSKCFMFSDSAHCKKFVWHDSLMKNMPKDFDFDFKFDEGAFMKDFDFDFDIDTQEDGKTVTIKHKGGKTIVINGEEENISMNSSDNSNTKTTTKTIIVEDDKTKTKKKVIVTTSVVVIDMDEEKGSGGRKSKEEHNFNFYPNPSDGNFVLDLDLNGKEDAQVRITDMNGKEVYSEKFSGNGKTSKTITLGNNKKGTFIVTIKQGKTTSSKKIIIE